MSRNVGLLLLLFLMIALSVVGGSFFFIRKTMYRQEMMAREAMDEAMRAEAEAERALREAQDKPKFAEDRVPNELKPAPIDGERAMKYLKQLLDIGTRISGSEGMTRQQELVTKHFEGLGGKVTRQEFTAKQRSTRNAVKMTNLIASWNPDKRTRVIFCTHYDTRPAAHEEPNKQSWNKPFLSANDGTAGVALLMEIAHHLKDISTGVGVDLVLFDGEEYVFDPGVPYVREGDKYFFGSEHFGTEYAKNKGKLPYRYGAAILLDLCGHDKARLAIEGYSAKFAPELLTQVWKVAAGLGAKSFSTERGFQRADDVLDDHLALNQAGIPAIDIIDFDYAHWHLLSDTLDKVSAQQLAEVGSVLTAWLATQK